MVENCHHSRTSLQFWRTFDLWMCVFSHWCESARIYEDFYENCMTGKTLIWRYHAWFGRYREKGGKMGNSLERIAKNAVLWHIEENLIYWCVCLSITVKVNKSIKLRSKNTFSRNFCLLRHSSWIINQCFKNWISQELLARFESCLECRSTFTQKTIK